MGRLTRAGCTSDHSITTAGQKTMAIRMKGLRFCVAYQQAGRSATVRADLLLCPPDWAGMARVIVQGRV